MAPLRRVYSILCISWGVFALVVFMDNCVDHYCIICSFRMYTLSCEIAYRLIYDLNILHHVITNEALARHGTECPLKCSLCHQRGNAE